MSGADWWQAQQLLELLQRQEEVGDDDLGDCLLAALSIERRSGRMVENAKAQSDDMSRFDSDFRRVFGNGA